MSDGAPTPRRLHPATLIARWLRLVPQMVGGGAAFAATMGGWGRFLSFAAMAGGIGLVITLLWWWRFRYTLAEREIIIESGVLNRQRRVIPFDRVQDIAIERRVIARLFGTARVKVETGGASSDEGLLDMIGLAEAQALRDRIRRGHSPTPVAGMAAEEPLLFRMDLSRILAAGLFNFSLLFLAAIFAVVQNLEQLGFVRVRDWINPRTADTAAGFFNLRNSLALLAALVVLGLVYGVVRTVSREFGFKLTRTGGGDAAAGAPPPPPGFRRRRGLFTLSDVVIPIRRTQVGLIESGPIARQLGWFALAFQTLGAETKEGGVQAVAPFARMDEILPILTEAGFPVPPERSTFTRIPRRALWRWAAPFFLVGATATAAAFLIAPGAGVAGGLLLAAGFYAAFRWRKHGFALDDRALFVRAGLLKRRMWIIPFEKAQTISVTQGPVQRRLRLASLLLDTAGASSMRSPEIVDLDAAEAEALAAKLLSLFHRSRSEAKPSQ
ncbi:PH domain-containing protein [Sphingosinicella terrae]|uniref:PH domain-containing protein n=1 Tax=Sphingosinicella terrae TaxID=2172047 RepID=UPI000E0DFEAC|nr:PH domain-containing protein [Sphingosinicella terrae]